MLNSDHRLANISLGFEQKDESKNKVWKFNDLVLEDVVVQNRIRFFIIYFLFFSIKLIFVFCRELSQLCKNMVTCFNFRF